MSEANETSRTLGEHGARLDALERGQRRFEETLNQHGAILSRIEAALNRPPPPPPQDNSQMALALMRVGDALDGRKAPVMDQAMAAAANAAAKQGVPWLSAVGLLSIGAAVASGLTWAARFGG